MLQSPVVAQLRTQYAEVARQEADFRAIYGDRHPSIVAIRAQATDLRRQIEREIARVVDGIRNDYQVAKSREAALERSSRPCGRAPICRPRRTSG